MPPMRDAFRTLRQPKPSQREAILRNTPEIPAETERFSVILRANRRDGEPETIGIAQIKPDAPWRWLAAGWSDFVAMPAISLFYGGLFSGIAIAIGFGLAAIGWTSAILALAGGFLLIAPILAVGPYEASRRRERGEKPGLTDVLSAGFASPGQLSLVGLITLLVFLIWLQAAFLLHSAVFGERPFPSLDIFLQVLLFTTRGLTLLAAATFVGGCLAGFVFVMAAIAAPMLIDRPVTASTALFASLNAVVLNPKPMVLWAVLLAGFTAAGLLTLCLGLAVVFPLLGYASWHGYREITGGAETHADDE
jgi:uncharacterized membrane protein